MMKNFKKFTALLLVLCMVFSLSISAFAAEADERTIYESAPEEEITVQSTSSEAVTSGTIPGSSIKWSLDSKGWLTISGSGEAPVFQSADDQPWAAVREQITEVWFEDMETLTIPDLAYWFEGCVNLTTAELPLAPVIGKHAFYGCSKLNTITMYYGETVLKSIGEDAFWRETGNGDTLTIYYILGYPEATVPFHDYDWAGSNRASRLFEDVYGLDLQTSIVGTCPSCGKNSLQGTYVSQTHTSRGHAEYYECYLCHYTKNLGTYVYKDHGDGTYGSWTCPSCGSHTWVLEYEQDATCTRNGYREYSCDCGQTKTETIYSSGHSYQYGSWEEYSSSQHRRESYCRNCGDSDYEYASHSMSYGSWSNYSSSQHSRTATCRTCGYSTTDYGNHSYSTGSWSKYSDTQHRRSKTCSGCGASTYDYADHSYSYGSWTKADDAQHKRTKTCSACGDSSEEYADHVDANGDGKCDDCGANIALLVTWDASSNGGSVGGKNSVTTSVAPNKTAVAPGYTPVKTGHTFSGWYTEKTGGALYNTVTITAARTFYAQFSPSEYQITWDLGTGKTETTTQTYGEKLNLPTEPTRKGYAFLGWFTQETGGTEVDGNTVFKEAASTTYYAHWEEATVFSVVVPAVLPVTVDQNGKVYVSNVEIVNHSTAPVQVSSVTLTAENGWTLVPYASDMSHAKVDSNQLGFRILNHETDKTGSSATFVPTAPWKISEEESLTLDYHIIQSFKPGEITPELALEIAQTFAAEHLADYEVVIGVHVDKEHIHAHMIFNSVNQVTGRKYHSNAKSYYQQIRGISDRLCGEKGLSVIMEGKPSKAVSYIEWLRQSRGQPTFRSMLEADLRDAIADANDLGHFFLLMEHKGYEIHHGNRLGFRLCGQERFMYPERKNAAFSEENIERAIAGNLAEIEAGIRPAFIPRPKPQPYRPHPKYKGFLALYYHYCYLLGRIEKRQYPPRMTPHLRQEITKAETYKIRLKFLQENNITTADDLKACMQAAENEAAKLAKQRTILNVRKKKRKKLFDALAAEEALAMSKALYEEGLSGMESEYAQYVEAKATLDVCGISRQALTEEKADIYEQLAQLNKQIRAERQKIKLCREIADSAAVMQRDVAAQEKSPYEKETEHSFTSRR